jgi:hypothetical protein
MGPIAQSSCQASLELGSTPTAQLLPAFLQGAVHPWHEEHITQTGLEYRCAWKEVIRKSTVNEQETDLISHAFSRALELSLGIAQCFAREVSPSEDREDRGTGFR